MKTGRNAPCPCGSGKKYKHCCLNASAESVTPSEDLLVWRRARRALEGVPARILNFTKDVYGDVALVEAWEEFHLWGGEDDEVPEPDPSSPLLPLFMSWFLHRWTPDTDTLVEDESLLDKSPTATFLERHRRLEPIVRHYLEGCLSAPFSFHEIVSAEAGRGFTACDVLTGEERYVIERSASEQMEPGDILFGQLVEVDGIVMLEAMSPFLLPPSTKIELVDFRRIVGMQTHVATPRERLLDLDGEIRDIYLEHANRILNPTLPDIRNTDGDPIEPHRLVLDIDSADAAFHALKHLSATENEQELLESATLDADGNVERVEIHWSTPGNARHASWSSTTLGRIEIDGQRLVAEVNSARRADTLRQIIESALGGRARYRTTEITNLERALADAKADPDRRAPSPDELAELPEVKAMMEQHMAAHYDEWVTTAIPALDGQTPLEAVAEAEGREKVEALLVEFERGAKRMNLDPALFRRLRQRLGLD